MALEVLALVGRGGGGGGGGEGVGGGVVGGGGELRGVVCVPL